MPGARNAKEIAAAEAKVIASRILARQPMHASSPDGTIHAQKFNTLLADAQKLAGFVLQPIEERLDG